MLPPRPPSPPLGPPRGTNFSRRNATQPFPPSPPAIRSLDSSINTEKPEIRNLGLESGNIPLVVQCLRSSAQPADALKFQRCRVRKIFLLLNQTSSAGL